MATLKLKPSHACILTGKDKSKNVYIDPLDHKATKYIIELDDNTVLNHIDKMPEDIKNNKSWEQGFHILSFSSAELNNKYKYYLKDSKPKVTIESSINQSTIEGIKDKLKKGDQVKPSDVLDMDITSAIDEIDLHFSNNDFAFITELQKLLKEYPDDDLIEYINDRMSDANDPAMKMIDLDNMGIKQLYDLADKHGIINVKQFKNKKDLISAIRKKTTSTKNIKNIKKKLK